MIYTYTLTTQLNSTKDVAVYQDGQQLYTINRYYSNGLKKLFDGYFDYRYFLQYDVKDQHGIPVAMCKKVQRKGRLWFEAYDLNTKEPFLINYENWRIGIPELFIKGQHETLKIDKEFEDWSNFSKEDEIVARWLAVFSEEHETFSVTFEVFDDKINVALMLAIAQATLFIGA